MDKLIALKIKSGILIDIVSDTIFNNQNKFDTNNTMVIPVNLDLIKKSNNVTIVSEDLSLLTSWMCNVILVIDNKNYYISKIVRDEESFDFINIECKLFEDTPPSGYAFIRHINISRRVI